MSQVDQLKERFEQLLDAIQSIEPETTDLERVDELIELVEEVEQHIEKIKQQ